MDVRHSHTSHVLRFHIQPILVFYCEKKSYVQRTKRIRTNRQVTPIHTPTNTCRNEKLKVIAWYIIKPTVFLFQNALSYLLMLAVMTFNVGIFLAVIVGNTIGWAIFSMRSGITPEESCH
jgi:hypothetical protein